MSVEQSVLSLWYVNSPTIKEHVMESEVRLNALEIVMQRGLKPPHQHGPKYLILKSTGGD